MAKVESQSQTFFAHLSPANQHKTGPVSERKAPRLQTMTAQDMLSHLPGFSESKVSHTLTLLAADASELVTKVSFDQQLQLGRYALNW